MKIIAEVAQDDLDRRAATAPGRVRVIAAKSFLVILVIIAVAGTDWPRLKYIELVGRVTGHLWVEHPAERLDQVSTPSSWLTDEQHMADGHQRHVLPAAESRDVKPNDPHLVLPSRSLCPGA